MTVRFAVVALLGCAHLAAGEELLPVVAKQRSLWVRVNPDGSETVLQRAEGVYLRNARGDWLSRVGDRGAYHEAATGKTYEVSFTSRTAWLRDVATAREKLAPPLEEVRSHALSEGVIEGLRVFCMPVIDGRTGEISGRGCRSFEQNLHVRMESTVETNGVKHKRVQEMYEIRLGQEPEEPVRIPPDFTILEGAARVQ